MFFCIYFSFDISRPFIEKSDLCQKLWKTPWIIWKYHDKLRGELQITYKWEFTHNSHTYITTSLLSFCSYFVWKFPEPKYFVRVTTSPLNSNCLSVAHKTNLNGLEPAKFLRNFQKYSTQMSWYCLRLSSIADTAVENRVLVVEIDRDGASAQYKFFLLFCLFWMQNAL